MQTEKQTSKPKPVAKQVTGEGCPGSSCSAGLLFDDGTIMRVVKRRKRAEAWMCEAAENPREMYEYSTNFILRHAIGFANVSCSQCGRDFGPGEHGYSHCSDRSPKGQCGNCKWAQEKEDRCDLVRQLLDLCERANTVMMGDTKHDGGEPEDDWIADYEAIRGEAQCAAGIHLYSTNWKDGKAYDYCPFCGHEPNAELTHPESKQKDHE